MVRCRSSFPGRPERLLDWPEGAPTALQALRSGQQPIASSCSGETVCGRCVVQILGGDEALSPPQPDEEAVLTALGADPGDRLACRLGRDEVQGELVLGAHYW